MTILALHVMAVSYMCGLGWMVQIVHYPLFDAAAGAGWDAFHRAHSQRITWVVGPAWAVQGITVLALVLDPPDGVGLVLPLVAAVLAGTTVLATIALALPAHERLASGYSAEAHRRLVSTNWVRTIAWTAGMAVAGWMVVLAA